jgi:hypothetical protein
MNGFHVKITGGHGQMKVNPGQNSGQKWGNEGHSTSNLWADMVK